MSKLIDDLKARTGDDRPAAAITWDIGQQLEQSNNSDVFAQNPDFTEEYRVIKKALRPDLSTELGSAFSSALMDRMPEDLFRAGAAAVGAVSPGSSPQKYLLDQAEREREEGAARRGEVSVPSIEDIHDAGDLGRWAATKITENIPQVGVTLIPGIGVESTLGKLGAMAAANIPLTAGGALGQLSREKQETRKGSASALAAGVVGGVAGAAAELVPFLNLPEALKKTLVGSVLARGGLKGAATRAAVSTATDAPLMAVQEAVNIAQEEYATGDSLPDDIIKSRLKNAAAMGGVIGAAMGGARGLIPAKESPDAQPKDIAEPDGGDSSDGATPPPPAPQPPQTPADAALEATHALMQEFDSALASRSQDRPEIAAARHLISGFEADQAEATQSQAERDNALRAYYAKIEADDADLDSLVREVGLAPRGAAPALAGGRNIERGLSGFDVSEPVRTRQFAEGIPPLEGAQPLPGRYDINKPLLGEGNEAYAADAPDVLTPQARIAEGLRWAEIRTPEEVAADLFPQRNIRPKEEASNAVQEPKSSHVPEAEPSRPVPEVEEKVREAFQEPAKTGEAEVGPDVPLADAIKLKQRIPGGDPLFGRVFSPEDGAPKFRVEDAVTGFNVKGDLPTTTRKAIIIQDRANGQILVRGIRRDQSERGGVRAQTEMIDSMQSKARAATGERRIDPVYGSERAPWEFVSSQNYRGLPRFEPIGYLVYDKPRANISYTLGSIDDLNSHPSMVRAFGRYENRGAGESSIIQRRLAPYFNPGAKIGPEELKAYRKKLKPAEYKKLVEANDAIPGTRFEKPAKVKLVAAESSPEGVTLESPADIAIQNEEGGAPIPGAKLMGGRTPRYSETVQSALSEVRALLKEGASTERVIEAAKRVILNNPQARRVLGLSLTDIDPAADALVSDAAKAVARQVAAQGGQSIALTKRADNGYVATATDSHIAIGNFFDAVRASGADVVLVQRDIASQWDAIRKGYGFKTVSDESGRVMIGIVGDWMQGKPGQSELIKAAHEAAHVFLENSNISQDDYSLYQSAVAQLPWTDRMYLNNPLSNDLRVIANANPEYLSDAQRNVLIHSTPDEIKAARAISPEELAVEQATEHLALFGVSEEQSRDFFTQLIRFIKDIGYRIGISLQKALKGPDAVNPELVNAYVQNRFLQWLNRDFAASNSAIALKLSQWIGAPASLQERIPVYDNIEGDNLSSIWYDPITGYARVDGLVTDDVRATRDQVRRIVQGIQEGKYDALLTAAPETHTLSEIAADVPFEKLTRDQQLALMQESKRQMDGAIVQRNDQGQLLAPNGRVSKLPEGVYRMVRTDIFKQAFGDWMNDPANSTKVIDPETGEPAVQYHGTTSDSDFEVFDRFRHLGHHFGSADQAEDVIFKYKVTRGVKTEMKWDDNARLYPVFLDIKNPVRVRDYGYWPADQIAAELFEKGILTQDEVSNFDPNGRDQGRAQLVSLLKSKGVDGLVYVNTHEGMGGADAWIAFDSNQVKSIYNRTFTPTNNIRYTQRASEALTAEGATIEANTQFASVNSEEETYQNIFKHPDVQRFLPVGTSFDDFLGKFLQLSESKNPKIKRDAIQQELSGARSADDNLPINFDPMATVASLPSSPDGSSGQQKAIRNSLIKLNEVRAMVNRRLANSIERQQELDSRSDNLTAAEKRELDKLNSLIPMLERTIILKDVGLDDQVARLEGKMGASYLWTPAPGAEYLVPPTPDADAAAVESSRAKIPAGLAFDTPAKREFLNNQLKIKAWLDNPANRDQGAIYGQLESQLLKMSTISTDPAYTANTFRFRNMFFDSMRNSLRAIGTPNAKYLAGRFDEFEGHMLKWGNKLNISGGQWSVAYQAFKKAIGWKGADADFRRNYWNTILAFAEDIPDGVKDPSSAILNAMAKIAKRPVPPHAESAFRELMRKTRENEALIKEIFNDIGLKVSDPVIRENLQRTLIRQGSITGRRSISEQLERVHQEMRPVWSNTAKTDIFADADTLSKNDPLTFSNGVKALFTPTIIKNFVEPLIYSNRQYIKSVDQGNGLVRMANLANVREAYEKSGGDMVAFAKTLNTLEGGNPATEAAYMKSTLGAFNGFYHKVTSIINERQKSQNSGIEVLPRQIMDTRQADDLPPEFVKYAIYDAGSNRTLLYQMAMNGAFGRNGLTTGIFAQNLSSVVNELKALHIELSNYIINDGLTKEQASELMGKDRYLIASQAQDHLKLMDRFVSKMEMATKSSGEQMADLRVINELLGFNAMMILQSPRSALVNTLDLIGPFYRTKMSSETFSAVYHAAKHFGSEMFHSLAEAVGIHVFSSNDLQARMQRLGFTDPDLYLSFRDKFADYGAGNSLDQPEGIESGFSKLKRKGIRAVRIAKGAAGIGVSDIGDLALRTMSLGKYGAGDKALRPGDANLGPKLRTMGIFNTVAHALTNSAVVGQYKNFADMVSRGVEYIKASADPDATAAAMNDGSLKLDPDALGYTRKWMIFNDRAAFDYMQNAISEKLDQGSLEQMVADAYARTKADPKAPVITDNQFVRIANLALTEVQLNSNVSNTPIDLKSNGLWKLISPFVTWPYLAMLRVPALFKDPSGRYTMWAALDGAAAIGLGAVPLTMAASMMVDLYDEKIAGKRNNLRDIKLDENLPMAVLERAARYGVGGLGSEALNAALNYDDTRGGFSADTRILMFSQLQNLKQIIGNLWQTGGNVNYAATMRPFMQFLGAGGVLQYQQILNHSLGLSNDEAAINERINVGNYLRAAGRDLDLEVRISRGPTTIPTPVTPHIQQMELAVYEDDLDKFRDAYRDAVQAYRETHPDEPDPAKQVISSFRSRHPLTRIFRSAPSSAEYRNILEDLNGTGQEAVQSAVVLFNRYLGRLGAKPLTARVEPTPAERAARRTSSFSDAAVRAAQALAAQASYHNAFQ